MVYVRFTVRFCRLFVQCKYKNKFLSYQFRVFRFKNYKKYNLFACFEYWMFTHVKSDVLVFKIICCYIIACIYIVLHFDLLHAACARNLCVFLLFEFSFTSLEVNFDILIIDFVLKLTDNFRSDNSDSRDVVSPPRFGQTYCGDHRSREDVTLRMFSVFAFSFTFIYFIAFGFAESRTDRCVVRSTVSFFFACVKSLIILLYVILIQINYFWLCIYYLVIFFMCAFSLEKIYGISLVSSVLFRHTLQVVLVSNSGSRYRRLGSGISTWRPLFFSLFSFWTARPSS